MAWTWFKSPKEVVIEVHSKPSNMVEDEAVIRSLAEHPGFEMLLNRYRRKKAVLETLLKRDRHTDIRSVDSLQNGIAWAEFFETELNKVLAKKKEVEAIRPSQADFAQFTDFLSRIEGVGPPQDDR